MEQAQEVKAPEQVEVWEEVKSAVAEVGAVVLRQVPADTASARTVGKGLLTNWEFPAMSSNATSVEPP